MSVAGVPESAPWMAQARCRGLDDADKARFHSHQALDEDFARSICRQCPVTEECLAMAMGDSRLQGIYAGLTYQERWGRSER